MRPVSHYHPTLVGWLLSRNAHHVRKEILRAGRALREEIDFMIADSLTGGRRSRVTKSCARLEGA